jgi:sigma-E factor negative regulatory protein RseB
MRWLALALVAAYSQAWAQQQEAALTVLQRIYQAANRSNYTGIFVFQQGNSVETSRITHLVDAQGSIEKLEALDGTPREVIRRNDEVKCYLPASRTVKIERRPSQMSFPHLQPASLAALAEHYTIRLGEIERVAGHEAQAVLFEPKDAMRFGHKLWAETNTGLLLRARTVNERGEVVEQYSFTQLSIGGNISRELVRPRFGVLPRDWQIENAAPSETAASGWAVRDPPPGFKKIAEITRLIPSRQVAVNQMVYSDGMAAISIFIEPLRGSGDRMSLGISKHGALSIYTRRKAEYLVTVVGETPPGSVVQIGNQVEFRRGQ